MMKRLGVDHRSFAQSQDHFSGLLPRIYSMPLAEVALTSFLPQMTSVVSDRLLTNGGLYVVQKCFVFLAYAV